jgi:hypothetical protein
VCSARGCCNAYDAVCRWSTSGRTRSSSRQLSLSSSLPLYGNVVVALGCVWRSRALFFVGGLSPDSHRCHRRRAHVQLASSQRAHAARVVAFVPRLRGSSRVPHRNIFTGVLLVRSIQRSQMVPLPHALTVARLPCRVQAAHASVLVLAGVLQAAVQGVHAAAP